MYPTPRSCLIVVCLQVTNKDKDIRKNNNSLESMKLTSKKI